MEKKRIIFILNIICMLLLVGCNKNPSPIHESIFALDTVITITVYDEQDAEIIPEAMDKIKSYDSLFSKTNPDSDIYKINHANGEWTTVSKETISLLSAALYYCELSAGDIDITISGVKDLWDFQKDNSSIPEQVDIQNALSHVDYHKIELDGNRVRLLDTDTSIDLGFIAKGYIADALKKEFEKAQVSSAIISLGGNIITIGNKPDDTPFTIGIQKPFGKEGETITTTSLGAHQDYPTTAVTSGIYERYFEKDGKLYHHILDTQTGYPVETDLYSVTILSNSSVDADALSTFCLVIGSENAKEIIEAIPQTDAIFILKNSEEPLYIGNDFAN